MASHLNVRSINDMRVVLLVQAGESRTPDVRFSVVDVLDSIAPKLREIALVEQPQRVAIKVGAGVIPSVEMASRSKAGATYQA